MPLWLERYILPICAAIVFGVCILNPFKFDWQQRLALFVAISAFAYFIAHTAHRPKTMVSAKAAPDPRIDVLEQQVGNLKAQQEWLRAKQVEAETQRKKRQEAREQITKRLIAGNNLKAACDSLQEVRQIDAKALDWNNQTVKTLQSIDSSFVARFQNPNGPTYSRSVNGKQVPVMNEQIWNYLNMRTEALGRILETLPP